MVSSKHIAILATSILGLVSAKKCKPQEPSSTKSTPISTPTDTGIWLGSSTESTNTGTWLGFTTKTSTWLLSPTGSALGVSANENRLAVGPAPLTCWPASPNGSLCSKNGFVSKPFMDSTSQGPEASVVDCQGACTLMPGCTAFAYNAKTRNCYTSARPWAEADFVEDNGDGSIEWSQIECLDCFDNSILNLGFEEDSSVDSWTLEGDLDLGWFLDNPAVPVNYNRALRIGEPTAFADATATYNPTFPIKASVQYQFGYRLRIDRSNHIVTPFDAVTFYVSTNDEVVYEFTPQGSKDTSIEGKEKFTLLGGEEGDATFQIGIKGTRSGLDYYFDYIYITWIYIRDLHKPIEDIIS
ncbi:hypothetical protein AK830_g8161 [Neonectria ditissima]|uniref:Apple domain-containing protein n=1 Tax=Neonectria ditissima TaxID=78410 RepID=A0A0P7BD71_9HYPO|nr:hypothetical protein AK830_g8161 [Neonectria ditissima]